VLGIVCELLVVEEKLLAGGEYKLFAAVDALQDSVFEFHGRLPQRRGDTESAMTPKLLAGPVSLSSCFFHNKGPGRTRFAANAKICPGNRKTWLT
jgi:hypothetical protein